MQLQHVGSESQYIAISFKSIKFRIGHQLSLLVIPLKRQNIVLSISSEAEKPKVTSLTTCFPASSFCLSCFLTPSPELKGYPSISLSQKDETPHIISPFHKGRLNPLHVIVFHELKDGCWGNSIGACDVWRTGQRMRYSMV